MWLPNLALSPRWDARADMVELQCLARLGSESVVRDAG